VDDPRRQEQLERLHRPRHPFADIPEATRAPESTLRPWLDRGLLVLDADAQRLQRQPGKRRGGPRRFSTLDVFKITVAHELVQQGITTSKGVAAAELLSAMLDNMAGRAFAFVPPEPVILDLSGPKPRMLLQSDDALVIVGIRWKAILNRVLATAGESAVAGTADDHRAEVDRLERLERGTE